MADADQHENLKDILGFDPNSSSDEPTGGGGFVPRPKDERHGWPENWRDLLEEAKSRRGFETHIGGVDEELFAIFKRINPEGVNRSYFSFDASKKQFERSSEANLFKDGRYMVITRADNAVSTLSPIPPPAPEDQ